MRFVQETTLTIFSLIILIISVVYSVILFGWLDVDFMMHAHNNIVNSPTIMNIILVINSIFIILALVAIFGDSSKKDTVKDGVLLENEKGNLLISKGTLENIIGTVVKGFESVEINSTKIELDEEGKLKVDIIISVSESAIIKDLTNNLQNKIKEAIKKASDLEVRAVNVSIKGILPIKPEIAQ